MKPPSSKQNLLLAAWVLEEIDKKIPSEKIILRNRFKLFKLAFII